MWPFRRKPLVDDWTARWILNNFAWLIRNHGLHSQFAASVLVLPDEEHLATNGERGHDLALTLFEQVKAYCGLAGSPVPLVEGARLPGDENRGEGRHTLGTYGSGDRSAPFITYQPNLLNDSQGLIATFAHELGHHLMLDHHRQERMLVKTAEEEERLTDLAAIFMGFGVFLSNCAYRVKTHDQGWTSSHHGYLPEREVIFATALYITVKRIDAKAALRHLKYPRGKMLKHALSDIEAHRDAIATMRLLIPPIAKPKASHLRLVK